MKSKKQSIMKRKMYKFKNQFISKSVHLLIMMLISSSIFAQVPNTMSYQAVVRDENGQLVKSQSVGIRISILQGSMDGTEIFQEIYIPSLKTNANGLLSMEIGTGTALVGEFSDIDWTAGPYFIKTETDPKGGTNYTLTGTNQLLSVPYAMHAKTAEIAEVAVIAETAETFIETDPIFTAWDKDYSDLTNKPNIKDTVTTYGFSGSYNDLANKPTLFNGNYQSLTKKPNLKDTVTTYSFSGNYNNLTNTPTTISGYGITDAVTTSGNQSIAGNKTFTGTTTVKTPVNATDATTKAYVDALLARIEALENSEPMILANGFTDPRDGNHYNVVKIGNQVWMAENLKYLPSVVGPGTGSSTTPYYYVYGYNGTSVSAAKATANYTTYGVLYNWKAAMDSAASSTANPSSVQGVCPAGWHLPSDAEWTQLENFLANNGYNYDGSTGGGRNKIAKAMASTGGWNSSSSIGVVGNTDYSQCRNKSGFTALPGGIRGYGGTNNRVGDYGYWWSATESDAASAWHRFMGYNNSNFLSSSSYKENGFSVRCVRD